MAQPAGVGTKVFITVYRADGDHPYISDRYGVIGVYGDIDTAKGVAIEFVRNRHEEELEHDKWRVEKLWSQGKRSDADGWYFGYSMPHRLLEAKVLEHLVE